MKQTVKTSVVVRGMGGNLIDNIMKTLKYISKARYVSNCCHADLSVWSAEEGTNYYVCDTCGKPCNPVRPRKTFGERLTEACWKQARETAKWWRNR